MHMCKWDELELELLRAKIMVCHSFTMEMHIYMKNPELRPQCGM